MPIVAWDKLLIFYHCSESYVSVRATLYGSCNSFLFFWIFYREVKSDRAATMVMRDCFRRGDLACSSYVFSEVCVCKCFCAMGEEKRHPTFRMHRGGVAPMIWSCCGRVG